MRGGDMPAFPEVPGDSNAYEGRPGMTLRDWFAGQAVMGMMAAEAPDTIYELAGVASRAYRLADALLSEREKGAGCGWAAISETPLRSSADSVEGDVQP